MKKNFWLVGSLILLGVLVVMGWQRFVDLGAEGQEPSATAAAPDTPPGKQDDRDRPLEPVSEPAKAPASAASQLNTPSGTSDNGDQDEPGESDVRWQAAVGLPEQVREELANSDDPRFKDMLRRNRQLTRPGANDTWGPEMQERLTEFFLSTPEGEGLLMSVACRQTQCQVQAMSPAQTPAGTSIPSQALFDELRQHWWFREQLTLAQGHVTLVNGRLYQLQYLDRKQ